MPNTVTYEVPAQYGGKTLSDIRNITNASFRPDILASFLGIGENQPLSAGQYFQLSQLPQHYQNSGEAQALRSIFTQGPTVQARQQEEALAARNKAIQPAVQSLQESIPEQTQKFATERGRLTGEIEPMKQRYQSILDELKRKEGVQVQTAQTAASREFGQRGIPLSSTAFADYLRGIVNPIQSEYANLQRSTGLEQESGLRGLQNLISGLVPQEVEANRTIRNAMAQLQAGAGQSAIEDAFRQLQFMESQRQFNQQQALAQRELEQYKIPSLAKTETTDLSKQFLKIGEGEQLFDLSKLQSIFKNPKTFKQSVSSQFGGDEWEYI